MNRTTPTLIAATFCACFAGSAWAQPVGLSAPERLEFLPLVPGPVAGGELAAPDASVAAGAVYYADSIMPMRVSLPEAVRITTLVDLAEAGNRSGNAAMYSWLREGGARPRQLSSHNDSRGEDQDHNHGHRHGRLHLDDDGPGGEVGEHGGVTPVPLPPALPLLGSVLAALLLAGAFARRS